MVCLTIASFNKQTVTEPSRFGPDPSFNPGIPQRRVATGNESPFKPLYSKTTHTHTHDTMTDAACLMWTSRPHEQKQIVFHHASVTMLTRSQRSSLTRSSDTTVVPRSGWNSAGHYTILQTNVTSAPTQHSELETLPKSTARCRTYRFLRYESVFWILIGQRVLNSLINISSHFYTD